MKSSFGSAPGITSQRSSLDHLQGDRVALGHPLPEELALPLAEVDLAQVGLDRAASMPSRSASGAAVCAVRRSVVT